MPDTRGLGRTTAGRLGAQRLLDAQRANADPHSREGTTTASHPLGEVQGRAQGFRHGRPMARKRCDPFGREKLPQRAYKAAGARLRRLVPTEAEAARPPKGGIFLPCVGLGRAHIIVLHPFENVVRDSCLHLEGYRNYKRLCQLQEKRS